MPILWGMVENNHPRSNQLIPDYLQHPIAFLWKHYHNIRNQHIVVFFVFCLIFINVVEIEKAHDICMNIFKCIIL